MKEDDIDLYVEELFRRAELAPPDDDKPSLDDRMAAVEQAIGEAYDNAMRWHEAQIAGHDHAEVDGEPVPQWHYSWDGATFEPPVAYPALRRYPRQLTPEARRQIRELRANPQAFAESQKRGLTCGEIAVIALAIMAALAMMVVLS